MPHAPPWCERTAAHSEAPCEREGVLPNTRDHRARRGAFANSSTRRPGWKWLSCSLMSTTATPRSVMFKTLVCGHGRRIPRKAPIGGGFACETPNARLRDPQRGLPPRADAALSTPRGSRASRGTRASALCVLRSRQRSRPRQWLEAHRWPWQGIGCRAPGQPAAHALPKHHGGALADR